MEGRINLPSSDEGGHGSVNKRKEFISVAKQR
jgi:hypothetical protein